MSTYIEQKLLTLPTGADFNGKRYCTVRIDSDGRAALGSASTDVIVGIVAEDPKRTTASDGSDSIAVASISGGGVGLVKIGATVSGGQIITGAADGEAAGVSGFSGIPADSMGFGRALAGGSDGDVIPFLAGMYGGPKSS